MKTGYQPTWQDGKEHGTGLRDCSGRYEAIKRYLIERMGTEGHQLPERPSVFELGAYNGYFCRRLADDFGAQCIAVDDRPFLEPYVSPSGGRVQVVHKLMSPEDVMPGGGVQDIVICMSVLHHLPNWYEMAQALLAAGRVCFIETASPKENTSSQVKAYTLAAERYFADELGAQAITTTPPINGHHGVVRPMWVIDRRE